MTYPSFEEYIDGHLATGGWMGPHSHLMGNGHTHERPPTDAEMEAALPGWTLYHYLLRKSERLSQEQNHLTQMANALHNEAERIMAKRRTPRRLRRASELLFRARAYLDVPLAEASLVCIDHAREISRRWDVNGEGL